MKHRTGTGGACAALIVPFLLAVPAALRADTLTFDDVTTVTATGTTIPNGYGGLDWAGFFVLYTADDTDSGFIGDITDTGFARGTVSEDYVAVAQDGDNRITSASLFNLDSAYITAAWNLGLNVTVDGFRDGAHLYTQTVTVDNDAPTLFNFNYAAVDEIHFTAFGGSDAKGADFGAGTHFAMDDLTISAAVAPVPLPAAAWAGMALFGLIGAKRMRRRTSDA